jgi:dCTP deaminase
MIDPFIPHQVKTRTTDQGVEQRIVSYGLSSYGYDVRLANTFKIFTNVRNAMIDPLAPDDDCFVEHEGDCCVIPPNSYVLGYTYEWFHLPRDIIALCIGKSTYARLACFTGETKIALTDNTNPTFIEAIKRVENGERLFGYSVDEHLNIVVEELIEPRFIKHERIIEVELDNGDVIECTPDHRFITANGLEVPAEKLTIGESLFPLYRIESRGYEAVVQPMTWTYISTHFLADQWNLENGFYEKSDVAEHRHHRDYNKRNNNPFNIKRISASEHIRHHNLERYKDIEVLKHLSQVRKEYWKKVAQDPEKMTQIREKHANLAKMKWQDPQFREYNKKKLNEFWASSEAKELREKKRQEMRLRMANERLRQDASERLQLMWKDSEFREMMSEQCRALFTREDLTKEAIRDALESEGSLRGAARKLNCDRSVFRRFPTLIAEYKEKWKASKMTVNGFYNAMLKYGSATKAAHACGVSRSYVKRHFKEAVSRYYGRPIAENHKVVAIRQTTRYENTYCLTAPRHGNFALASGVFVNNCAINITPIEPEFEGHIVVEIANNSPLPLKVYAHQGIAQALFLRGDTACDVSYSDRGGKYQGQRGLTLARL